MAMLPKRYIITYTTVLKFEVGKIFILLLFFFVNKKWLYIMTFLYFFNEMPNQSDVLVWCSRNTKHSFIILLLST